MTWLRQLDVWIRHLVPFASALLAVLIDVLPWPGQGVEAVNTFSTLCVAYFWSLYRPDLFTPTAAFLTGLTYDAVTGLPLGLTPLVLLVTRSLVVTQQRFFLAWTFPVVWACFGLLATGAIALRWLLASLWWGHPFAASPLVAELALTIALYPVASALLGRIHNRVPGLVHAP